MYNVIVDIDVLINALENEIEYTLIKKDDHALYIGYIENMIKDGLYNGAMFNAYDEIRALYDEFVAVDVETINALNLLPYDNTAGPRHLVRRDELQKAIEGRKENV